jgi:tellurite methyltransferase
MKYARVIERYNQIFADDDSGFCEKPLPIVEALPKFISSGDVLDIGAGPGGNSLYLASQGFNVTASDISRVAIQKIVKKAEAAGLFIETQVNDLTEMELKHEFDVIICTFVMHHFSREEAELAIRNVQRSTRRGGFNIIASFTNKAICLREAPHSVLTSFISMAKKSSKASIRIGRIT